MHRLNKQTLILTFIYLLITAFMIRGIVWLLLKYITALAGLISWGTAALFIAICLSGVYWSTALFIAGSRHRKPILEEEQRIMTCLEKLTTLSDQVKKSRLKIVMTNTESPNAYAVGRRTICLSFGLLCITTEDELCAVMAHEAGHIICGDTFFGAIYLSAQRVSMGLVFIMRITWHELQKKSFKLKIACALAYLCLVIFYPLQVTDISIAVLLWAFGLRLINSITQKLHLYFSRLTEYRQDAFASSLGFGVAMKMVLLKLYFIAPDKGVTTWDLIHRSTHPVIHHRIRALENLNGLRK